MVTIIALDCSLSMARTITSDKNGHSKLDCSKDCAELILKYLYNNQKLSQVACLAFSSKVQLLTKFSRIDKLEQMILAIRQLKYADKTDLEGLFMYVKEMVEEQWGSLQMVDFIIFTDAQMPASLNGVQDEQKDVIGDFDVRLYPFPCRLHVLCLETSQGLTSKTFEKSFDKYLSNSNCEPVFHPLLTAGLSNKAAYDAAMHSLNSYVLKNFKIFNCKLHFGSIGSEINIFPTAHLPRCEQYARNTIVKEIKICGFLSTNDVGTPPVVSRHLVVPSTRQDPAGQRKDEILVLLYGSLTQDNKVAFIQLFDDYGSTEADSKPCFGFIHAKDPNEKDQHNLLISLLSEGVGAIPWLGDFDKLGFESQFESWTDKKSLLMPAFPVNDRTKSKCSYASSSVSWTRSNGLQTDLQKLLRTAKKLPDKSQAFYKDLNRLRRAALTFGFSELIHGMAAILKRERSFLPQGSNSAAHLMHAITQLEASMQHGYDFQIDPLPGSNQKHSKR